MHPSMDSVPCGEIELEGHDAQLPVKLPTPFGSAYSPGEQTGASQKLDPGSELLPEGQSVQDVDSLSVEYVPVEQGVQPEGPVARNEPAGHNSMHTVRSL